jgi:hypothetical protein
LSPSIRVAHALPGRIRLKIGALKGDFVTAHALLDVIADLAGVADVDVSPATGSVLVVYDDGTTTARRLAELAAALSPLVPDVPEDHLKELLAAGPGIAHQATDAAGTIRAAMSGLNGGVATLSGGVDLAVLVPVGLAALGVGSLLLAESAVLPEWYTFLWFAFGTWVALNAATSHAASEAGAVDVAL